MNVVRTHGAAKSRAELMPDRRRGGVQYKRLFARADVSCVRASSYTPGGVFGPSGMNRDQPRGVLEIGFLF